MPALPAFMIPQCTEFLRHLRRTGNLDAAAAAAGLSRAQMQSRRKRFPDFATRVQAALAYARARLARGGTVLPEGGGTITAGGEYTVSGSGKRPIQVRRAAPGRLSATGEREFLATLAATCNVRLSAERVGVTHTAIYARRRRSVEFDRQMREALAIGFERLELALFELADLGLTPDEVGAPDWIDAADTQPSPLGRMSPDQAIRLLEIHRRTVREHAPRIARNARRPTSAETDAAIIRALDALEARNARAAARQARKKEPTAAP